MDAKIISGNPIKKLHVLHNNPFIFAAAMHAFYEALSRKEQSILLAYLVLPIVLPRAGRSFLVNANSRSSFRTMISKDEILIGLPARIVRHRKDVNLTIQYLVKSGLISIDGGCVNVSDRNVCVELPSPDGLARAAKKLGSLFAEYEVPMIYRMLGVRAI